MSLLEHPTAQTLLADAELSAADVRGCSQRLERFMQRYLPRFYRDEQRALAEIVVQGSVGGKQFNRWPSGRAARHSRHRRRRGSRRGSERERP